LQWNTALTILPNRTAIAGLRALFPWRAEDYADNTTWHAMPPGTDGQGPALPDSNIEDPALWFDFRRGAFHAIMHTMDAGGPGGAYCGGHAFSTNGWQWTYSGTAYSCAQNYSDGSWQEFARRERPHILFAPDGVTPIALSNGVQYAAPANVTCKIGGSPYLCDPIFTLVAPLQT